MSDCLGCGAGGPENNNRGRCARCGYTLDPVGERHATQGSVRITEEQRSVQESIDKARQTTKPG